MHDLIKSFFRAMENRVYYNGAMPWDSVHALVNQAKAGDARAWEQLVALTRPHMLSVALRIFDRAAPWQSVSDLLQETWVRAWQGLADFRGGSNDVETGALLHSWLTRTLKRIYSKSQRYANADRRKPPGLHSLSDRDSEGARAGLTDPVASEPTPSTVVRREDAQRHVDEALAQLNDATDQAIIRLCFFDEMSLKQVAEKLALPYHEVRQRYHRSLQHLGKLLKGWQ
jgi:RNA polymerase sigma factor (sigma-70 family)